MITHKITLHTYMMYSPAVVLVRNVCASFAETTPEMDCLSYHVLFLANNIFIVYSVHW